ncbi:endonuclease/exonuclease/phosphatase family protein [Urechidicola croceus]|uniref:Endonuclease n=1 Tax=Urechidicola croceus TaxID=1850246 RepID=A0A1D8P5Y7_9FLAO|nr:endonuclease/exonuclease/phosphatase family protein [Urechidicola croceus]AOW19980.1 endonuclease [Urechidicola croceus]
MRNLSWFGKLIFVINSLFATILLLSYLQPYISPILFPQFSILSLAVPGLIIINLLFLIYWLIKLKRQFFLSTIVLIIGFQFLNSFYRISEKKVLLNDDLKIMSYNVRLFNIYKWKKEGKEETVKLVSDFIYEKDPDVICFQEFLSAYNVDFNYKYKFIKKNPNKSISYFGQAIYSKYKIINEGSLNFKSNANNAIFVDIIKDKDTIRVYNVHLESQKLKLNEENFGEKDSEKLLIRFQNNFKQQAQQAEQLVEHESNCKYKTIICGDFNNTAFSWVYHKIKGTKNDAFVEAGKGFGKSYDFYLPARIDFILADKEFEINNFKTYDINYSDHFPIMARLGTKKQL